MNDAELVRLAAVAVREDGGTKTTAELTALADRLAGGVIVPVHDCPDCDNCGYYAVMDRQGNPEQVQCQFCYTVPNSRFNIEAMLTASEAK